MSDREWARARIAARAFLRDNYPDLDFGVALPAVPSQPVDELRDPAADLGELGLAEAARRPGGRAEADPRRVVAR